ncbi:MAG: SusC/RagA family TonB-linked outer membrane protein [Hymenobacteraceae bacterium]|nr:SusC/RagA family TonB-linked outer membrane protein [Hymenobacteraceae bacterium]
MRKTLTPRFLLLGLLTWLLSGAPALAQTGGGTISGRVVDAKGEPVIGATVLVPGTTKGAATDVDGNFTIREVPAGTYKVSVTSVGLNTFSQDVTVADGGTASVSASMSENATLLAEAVVVGYGTARRQDITGSVATVSTKDFVQGQVTNPANLVIGKIAGVVVTPPSGEPGSGSPIRIRGGSSLNASNDPLIVIDGVAVDNKGVQGAPDVLSTINPNDIETFTILKDASATAIYGSRASNGVILITTKKGLRGEKLRLNFNTQFSVAKVRNKVDVLSGDEFRALIRQREVSPTRPVGTIDTSLYRLLGSANTDWQKEIYRTAYTSDNNLSLTGAIAEKVPFRASIGYLNQQGTLRGGNAKRNSIALGATPMLFDDHLRIDVNAKGVWADYVFADNAAISEAIRYDPTQPVRSDDPRYAPYGGYFQWLDGSGKLVGLAPFNPVARLEQRRVRSSVYRGIGNVQFDYKLHFLPDLHANLNLGYDIARGYQTTTIPSNAATNINATDPNLNGFQNQEQERKDNKLLDFYLAYGKNVGETGLRLDLTAGYSYQDFRYRKPSLPGSRSANGTVLPGLRVTRATDEGYTLLSYFGRANLNYKDRYLLTGTLRNDQTSRFAKGYRSGYFPAVGFAWRLKGESFLASSTAISDLKIRMSYGQTGQQDVGGYYPANPLYSISDSTAQYQLGVDQNGNPLYYSTARAGGYNSTLTWETTTTYNAGLDFGFLDNRVFGSVDIYKRKTVNLLSNVDFPGGSNLTNKLDANIGELENKGLEINLTALPVRRDDLTVSLNANATFNQQKITKLIVPIGLPGFTRGGIAGGNGNNIQLDAVGSPSAVFFVYEQVYENGKPKRDSVTGAPVLKDQNGDGKISIDDRIKYKQWQPKVALGFNPSVTYKRLSLASTMRVNLGNYIYNNVASNTGNYANFIGGKTYLANGSATINDTNFGTNRETTLRSSYYVQDASFFRMDNVTLGYDFGTLFQRSSVRDEAGSTSSPTSGGGMNLRLSLAVQNVFVVTKYTGLDPEIFEGRDNQTYPRSRTFTIGLNASF